VCVCACVCVCVCVCVECGMKIATGTENSTQKHCCFLSPVDEKYIYASHLCVPWTENNTKLTRTHPVWVQPVQCLWTAISMSVYRVWRGAAATLRGGASWKGSDTTGTWP